MGDYARVSSKVRVVLGNLAHEIAEEVARGAAPADYFEIDAIVAERSYSAAREMAAWNPLDVCLVPAFLALSVEDSQMAMERCTFDAFGADDAVMVAGACFYAALMGGDGALFPHLLRAYDKAILQGWLDADDYAECMKALQAMWDGAPEVVLEVADGTIGGAL